MKRVHFIWVYIMVICLFLAPAETTFADVENAIEDARNSIVEIQSGFVNPQGVFCQMQHGSGFLISNDEGATYIITNQSIAENSSEEIKKYCEKNNIKTENTQMSSTVRIVVKGDVTVGADILVKSEERNYCVLSTDNVVSEKGVLKLAEASMVENGDVVYALGFSETAENIDFIASDVKISSGKIEDKSQLKHSVTIHKGNAGGPLINEEGYVIGINMESSTESLGIDEVAEVLDNFSIYYGSQSLDESHNKLKELYDECLKLESSKDYKKASIEGLSKAIESTKSVLEEEKPQIETMENAFQILTDAKDKLVLKTPKILVVRNVLAGCIVVVTAWLLSLVISNYKDKKKSQPETVRKERKSLELVQLKNQQVIRMEKESFYIGSKPDMVDFCIKDNRAISRQHGLLIREAGKCYFMDLNSLNGSKVNGVPVQDGQRVELHTGDEIQLADERFLLR